jgi:hypothetical protein
MVSKEVVLDLRKYKLAAGTKKTPSKRSKSKGEDEKKTPAVRFEGGDSNKVRGKSNDAT